MSKIPGGYILLARKITESEIMNKPHLFLKLWVWMLLKANWKDRDKLKRGQLLTTTAEMRDEMSYLVGYRKSTPTKDEIRSAYEALVKASMITTARTTRGMVVTICNYEYYQTPANYEDHNENHNESATKPAPTPHDTEEREEEKKENKPISASLDYDALLDWFWKSLPKQVGTKKKVHEKFMQTIKTQEQVWQLHLALRNYKDQVNREQQAGSPDLEWMTSEAFLGIWQEYIPDNWEESWPERKAGLDRRQKEAEAATPSDLFDKFWSAFPKKVGKGAAQKRWAMLKVDTRLTAKMVQAIEWQRYTDQWLKDNGQYIPNPATWLNEKRWLDER
jgi:ribosomal protein S24E